MDRSDQSENFVTQLTEHQNRLYGYIYSLLGDHTRAADVLQETNLVLWRKLAEFDSDKPFLPWAFAIARFQVLAHTRDRQRDRLLLDPDLAEVVSGEVARQAEQIEGVRTALRACLQRLTPEHRDLIEQRYFRSLSVADLAASVERSTGAIKVALLRIRRQLGDCVQKSMAEEN